MTERGRISRIEGDRAWVGTAGVDAAYRGTAGVDAVYRGTAGVDAAGCGAAEGCGGGCFGCHDPTSLREYEARVPSGLEPSPGDIVEVGAGGAGRAALVLFLLPLGLLVAAYAAAAIAGAESGLAAGAGLAGFILGVALALALKGKTIPADMPILLRILSRGGRSEESTDYADYPDKKKEVGNKCFL